MACMALRIIARQRVARYWTIALEHFLARTTVLEHFLAIGQLISNIFSLGQLLAWTIAR